MKLRKFRIVGGEDNNDDFAIDRELRMFWYYFFKIILMRFLPMQVVLSVIAHYFVLDRGSHYLEVFYYLIVTSLSIGYGDIFPSTPRHRIFASILILLSVGSMGDLVGNVATLVIRHRKLRKLQRLESLEQFLKDIKKMDILGDGKIHMCEYFEYMLLCLGLVDQELMDELRRSFKKFDKTSTGYVSKEDLKILNKTRLSSAKKKLELSRYKKHLKDVSSQSLDLELEEIDSGEISSQ